MTSTPSYTWTLIPTYTRTITPTLRPTPALENMRPYPNPYNPVKDGDLKIGINISQADTKKITLKIYTTGYRLIKQITVDKPIKVLQIATQGYINIKAADLITLSNATYYYYIVIKNQNSETKSKVEKLIIMK